MLKLPCESIVKNVIPSLRGEIVRKLYNDHNMAQKEIAKILGLSQPSISYYINHKRGEPLEILDQFQDKIDEIINTIAEKKSFPRSKILQIICSICECVRKDKS